MKKIATPVFKFPPLSILPRHHSAAAPPTHWPLKLTHAVAQTLENKADKKKPETRHANSKV